MKDIEFNDIFSPELLELINPTYPRWEKRWSGMHWEDSKCDCGCDNGYMVPDKDAIEYDVYVMEPPTLFGLLPKTKWLKEGRSRKNEL